MAGAHDPASQRAADGYRAPVPALRQRDPAIWALDEERHQHRFYGKALELSRYEYGAPRLAAKPLRVFTRDELLLQVLGLEQPA